MKNKISDIPVKDLKRRLMEALGNACIYAGCRLDKGELSLLTENVKDTLLDSFRWYTIESVEKAIKKGSMGEYGDFAGISVKTVCDFIRAYSTSLGFDRDRDGDFNRPRNGGWPEEPHSTGDDPLDTKRNILAMWAAIKYFGDDSYIGGNWELDYAFLLRYGFVEEYDGWLAEWREKAINYIIGESGTSNILDIRASLENRRNARERREAAADNGEVMSVVYKLRVKDTLKNLQQSSPDEFNEWYNSMTYDLPECRIVPRNDKYQFDVTAINNTGQ